MTSDQFCTALNELGWTHPEFAAHLAFHPKTLARWVKLDRVPVWAERYIALMLSSSRLIRPSIRLPRDMRALPRWRGDQNVC